MSILSASHARSALRSLVSVAGVAAGLAFASTAQAAITFEFNYSSDAGDAFNVSSFGADATARRDALSQAGSLFSNMFATHFTNSGTVALNVTGYNDLNVNTLASAGSNLYYFPSDPAGFNVQHNVRDILQGRGDPSGSGADGSVNVNFGYSWELDAAATPSGSEYDFYATMYHEFTHAVGFASLIKQNGTGTGFTSTGTSHYGEFDRFIVDGTGTSVIDPNTGLINQSVWDAASVSNPEGTGLFWNGAHGVAGNGGNLIPIFSPDPWQAGSSGSHVDDLAPFSSMMMSYSVGTGLAQRDYSAAEIGMLRDIGYSPTAVPEPETYAMMLAGLGALGLVRRRQKSA